MGKEKKKILHDTALPGSKFQFYFKLNKSIRLKLLKKDLQINPAI